MILHTIAPHNMIFPNQTISTEFVNIEGGIVELESTGKSVRRLISTNPSLYLSEQYTPGNQYNN